MKKVLAGAAIVATLAVSCANNNNEKTTTVTTDTTTTVVPKADTAATITTDTASATIVKYVSKDSKTNFSATYDANAGTAVIKNETTGKVYNMKRAVSGSGAKYEDADGNYFWEHQGEFTFGKGDKTEIEGTVVK